MILGIFCFIFECILRNCQQTLHKAFQSNGPIGNKDSTDVPDPDPRMFLDHQDPGPTIQQQKNEEKPLFFIVLRFLNGLLSLKTDVPTASYKQTNC